MHKIDSSTATSDNEFTGGDSAQGIASTELNAAWFNSVQRELCKIVTGLGGTLSFSDDTQIFAALQKIGIRGFNVSGDSYSVPTDWTGSTLLSFTADDFTVSGSFTAGCLVILAPVWGSSSDDEVSVSVCGNSSRLYYGQGLIYLTTSNGASELVRFTIPSANRIKTGYIEYKYQIDDNVVDLADYTGDNVDEWKLYSNWKVGQVKRVICSSGATTASFYGKDFAVSYTFEVPVYGYREFLCVGSVTSGGTTYAILKLNGPRMINETSGT